MRSLRKLKGRRGITLVEVLLVVALIAALLGIAAPNLLSERREIKLAELNGNARAVAVAVQSKLYGMKNKGTTIGSEFDLLNETAGKTYVQTSDGGTDVRYFANFGKTAATGSKILSGALTDVELLKNGKIVVVYSPITADILEVFYAEYEFLDAEKTETEGEDAEGTEAEGETDIEAEGEDAEETEAEGEMDVFLPNSHLFPAADESYLAENMIGSYFGDPKPDLSRKDGLPPFTAVWRYDDELYLELQMVQGYSAERNELWNKKLGIEVYAEIPGQPGSRKKEEVLIYAEGIFDSDFTVKQGDKTVTINKKDYDNALTLSKISSNTVTETVTEGGEEKTKKKSGILRFAFDSLVTTQMDWGNKKDYLRHQNYPDVTTMMSEVLYPRETIANWFNASVNPYLSFWKLREGESETFNQDIWDRIQSNSSATKFIDVDDTFRLHVKMYVLDGGDGEDKGTEEIKDSDNPGSMVTVRKQDENYGVLDLRSPNISPYFYALSTAQNKVTLSSVRDLNNLHYVFESENKVDTAALAGDIDGQLLYNKMCDVHKALMDTETGKTSGDWGYISDSDAISVNLNYFRNKKSFKLSGKKPASLGGGSYKIVSVGFSGRDANPGGLFAYAENCTFEYLDIVNPRVWRNGYSRTVLGEDVDHLIPSIGWGNVASGALAAVAVNCTFTNVRAYIASDQTLRVTDKGETPRDQYSYAPITNYRVTGNVVGGLVGVAIGGSTVQKRNGSSWAAAGSSSEVKATTFTNCAASTILGPECLYTAEECFVAGGLVGVTVGDVQIKSSYASSQLSGYYAGGLVGVVGDGTEPAEGTQQQDWEFNAYTAYGFIKGGKATGKLHIQNSFAAGVIQHMVRVGGGLIALIAKNAAGSPKGVGGTGLPVDVSDCYSAVNWQIVPPVAYGTFEGDAANYYLYPTQFDLPVTANVLARFTTEHSNVFSLQKKDDSSENSLNCGIACSSNTLITHLSKTETEPRAEAALKDEWVDKDKTKTVKTWKHLEFEDTYANAQNEGSYPFPMPEGNTEFWGNWIQWYDKDAASNEILTGKNASFAFDSYYATYYHNPWSMYPRNVDAGAITMRGITLKEDTIYIGGLPLDADGATLTGAENKKSYYWAQNAAHEDGSLYCGQGVYGATKITPGTGENTIDFASATYYKSSYKPLTGSDFHPGIEVPQPGIEETKKTNVTRLMWDHYGFYLLLDFDPNNESGNTKYYITIDDVAQDAYKTDDVVHNEGNMSYKDIYVNKDEFEKAIGYRTITLPMPTKENTGTNTGTEKTVEIIWNKESGLHVKANGEKG